uniref:Uncharacterized protein n=1 Tax=Acrobeloides nanus TaxID=290746 RepID=A0A914BUG4_9BILA
MDNFKQLEPDKPKSEILTEALEELSGSGNSTQLIKVVNSMPENLQQVVTSALSQVNNPEHSRAPENAAQAMTTSMKLCTNPEELQSLNKDVVNFVNVVKQTNFLGGNQDLSPEQIRSLWTTSNQINGRFGGFLSNLSPSNNLSSDISRFLDLVSLTPEENAELEELANRINASKEPPTNVFANSNLLNVANSLFGWITNFQNSKP